MLKKLLSLVITTLFLFQAIHFNLCTSYAWSFPWENNKASENLVNACEKKNKYNKLADLTCAISKLEKELRKKGIQEMTKVGENGEYNLYMWDYLQLYNFPKKMGKFLKEAKKDYIRTGAISNLTSEVGGLTNEINRLLHIDERSSRDVLKSFLRDNEYSIFSEEDLDEIIDKAISKQKTDDSATKASGFLGAVAGGIAGALTLGTGGAFLGFVGLGGLCYEAVSWWKSSSREEQSEEQRIKIDNCASALKQLLKNIQKGKWKYANSVLAQLNFDPEFYNAEVLMLDSKIKYSEEVKKNFDQDFKDLENELTQMINKNLDRRIDL